MVQVGRIGRSIARLNSTGFFLIFSSHILWAESGQIWSGLVEFGRIWSSSVGFCQVGRIGRSIARLNSTGFFLIFSSHILWAESKFGRVWSSLVEFGFGWILLEFGRICSSLVEFGRYRPSLVKFGRVWSSWLNLVAWCRVLSVYAVYVSGL